MKLFYKDVKHSKNIWEHTQDTPVPSFHYCILHFLLPKQSHLQVGMAILFCFILLLSPYIFFPHPSLSLVRACYHNPYFVTPPDAFLSSAKHGVPKSPVICCLLSKLCMPCLPACSVEPVQSGSRYEYQIKARQIISSSWCEPLPLCTRNPVAIFQHHLQP